MLILEAWGVCEKDRTILGYSPKTLEAYRIQANLLARELGNIDIEAVTCERLKEYLYKQKQLKPASLGFRIRFLRSFFRWAADEGYIKENPAAKLREPKLGKRVPKNLSEEDIEMLRAACKTPREHAIIEFLYTTGCRIGEAVKANISDIDWDKRSLIVLGKGDKEREVYFNPKCAVWLKKYIKGRDDNDPALFATERNPHRISISQMRHIVKKVAKRAEIEPNVHPHKLRHTYAVHLLDNGAPLEAIQQMLGHAKLSTTRLYVDLSGERRREIYRRYF